MQPELSEYFGLKPWDLEKLEMGEVDFYLTRLKHIREALSKAAR